MEISPLALVGIGLATMFFGYFFGLFEGRGQGYKRRKKEEPFEPKGDMPFARAEAPSGAPQRARPAGPRANHMLELSRDEAGQPQLSLDGHRVDPKGLAPAEHRRLVELMVMVRPWVEAGSRSKEAGSPASSMPYEAEASAAPFTPEPTQDRTHAAPPARSREIPAAPPPPAAGAGAAPMSLVGQIDAILQARIAGTPLASRAIRLAESLNGGAMVFVGQAHYDGVADVPDEEVRAAIHAAIAEWEKRYTPG